MIGSLQFGAHPNKNVTFIKQLLLNGDVVSPMGVTPTIIYHKSVPLSW